MSSTPSADNSSTLPDFANLGYFSTLAPIERDVFWQGRVFRFAFHVLDGEEERDVQTLVEKSEPVNEVDRTLCEVFARLSLSIVSVDGQSIAEEHPTVQSRLEWVSAFPSTLIDILMAEYQTVRLIPLSLVGEKMADPFSESAPTHAG